ncbi:MAG: hypothetical protein LHV68_05100 [Elusimicrobia bacterium]|nr:hypothetical protein [Candidatus Liberimonas magnetica]
MATKNKYNIQLKEKEFKFIEKYIKQFKKKGVNITHGQVINYILKAVRASNVDLSSATTEAEIEEAVEKAFRKTR